MSSRTHIRRLTRMVQARSEMSYAQALSIVVAASDAGTLPYPLDEAGMEQAAIRLAGGITSPKDNRKVSVYPGGRFVMRLGTVNLEGSTNWERWENAVADPLGLSMPPGVLISTTQDTGANRQLAYLEQDARAQGERLTVVNLVRGLYWIAGADKRETHRPWVEGSLEKILEAARCEEQVVSLEINEASADEKEFVISQAAKRGGALVLCMHKVEQDVLEAVHTVLRMARSRGMLVVLVVSDLTDFPKVWAESLSYAVVEPRLVLNTELGKASELVIAEAASEQMMSKIAELITGEVSVLTPGTVVGDMFGDLRPADTWAFVVTPEYVKAALPPNRTKVGKKHSGFLLRSDGEPNILGDDTRVGNSGTYLMSQCESAEGWNDVDWPNWIPEEVSKAIEEFWSNGRTPRSWVRDHKDQGAPRTGRRVELATLDPGDSRVEGYYVHCWNNIGRVVKENGSWEYVSFGPNWKELSPRTQEDVYDEDYVWMEKRECGCGWKKGPNGETLSIKCLEHAFD